MDSTFNRENTNAGGVHLSERADEVKPILQDIQQLQLLPDTDIVNRQNIKFERIAETTKLHLEHDLDHYDHSLIDGITPVALKQLRQLTWLKDNFNLIFIGCTGTGKSFLTRGLCYEALKVGYRAFYRTIGQIVETIKLKEVSSSAAQEYQQLQTAQLLFIDNMMTYPLEKEVALCLFQLMKQIHDHASIIVATNKNQKEWGEMLGDDTLANALLQMLLGKCEIIKLNRNSLTLENKKNIFKQHLQPKAGSIVITKCNPRNKWQQFMK